MKRIQEGHLPCFPESSSFTVSFAPQGHKTRNDTEGSPIDLDKEQSRNNFPISVDSFVDSFNGKPKASVFRLRAGVQNAGAFGLPLNKEVILNPFLNNSYDNV